MKKKSHAIHAASLFCAAQFLFGSLLSKVHAVDKALEGPPAAVKTGFEAVPHRVIAAGDIGEFFSKSSLS